MAAAPEIVRLRCATPCATCATPLPPGTFAVWDRSENAATCEACVAGGDEAVGPPSVGIDAAQSN
jgi:hypothetical protein